MTVCPHCGQPRAEKAQRGPLLVTREPHAVYWQGVRRDGLRPIAHSILFLLVQRGQASHFALEMLTDGTRDSVKVHVCRLRKWLEREAIPLAIRCEVGFGYRLA